jgi:hypothetical protein
MNSFRLLLLLSLLSYGSALGIGLIIMWVYKGSMAAKTALEVVDLLIYNENSNMTEIERGIKIGQAVTAVVVTWTLITLV